MDLDVREIFVSDKDALELIDVLGANRGPI